MDGDAVDTDLVPGTDEVDACLAGVGVVLVERVAGEAQGVGVSAVGFAHGANLDHALGALLVPSGLGQISPRVGVEQPLVEPEARLRTPRNAHLPWEANGR